jgi:hypothetical protein
MSHFKTIAPLYQSIKNWLEKLNHFLLLSAIWIHSPVQQLEEALDHHSLSDWKILFKDKYIFFIDLCLLLVLSG